MSSLALERRSQPQQILDLQQRHSQLTADFAKDSAALHQAWATLGKAHLEAYEQLAIHEKRLGVLTAHLDALRAFRARGRWARLRWLMTGR